MRWLTHPAPRPLTGTVRVPGDKSLSHRAVLFAAMADGTSTLTGVLDSADVRASIRAVDALGAHVEMHDGDERGLRLTITGWGSHGPSSPAVAIDCGNSGTTARLLLGMLAGWPKATVTLVGDESLSQRPMARVTAPLESMGASFVTRDGRLPVTVQGAWLHGIDYESPVASAQVKTAVLLAGVQAEGRTLVSEPHLSRDHTERLLPAFGIRVGVDPTRPAAWVDGPATPRAADVDIPADPSSAAFLAVAAAIVGGSEVTVTGITLNPTRTGFLRVLERMGAQVDVVETGTSGSEPVGDVRVTGGAPLYGTVVAAAEVPTLVDEIPILAVAAAHATGETRFEGVGELRVKESDRLAAVVEGLSALGADARAEGDVLVVTGPTDLRPATLESKGDHRLAMAWAVAGLTASGPVEIDGFEAVDVSYPRFAEDLAALAGEGRDVPAS